MSEGWVCPRCLKVNAPWVSQCVCTAVQVHPVPSAPAPTYPGWWPWRTPGTGDPPPMPNQVWVGDPPPWQVPTNICLFST